ncbi:MAG: trehalose-phosphatase [Chloroflexi bacterium]|nr:trehalose-phosphatase [Chloroflexota bacterium]
MHPTDTQPGPPIDDPSVQGAVTDPRALAASIPLDAGPLLIVSDFDGTLGEPLRDPWAATIVPAARRALRRIAAHPTTSVAFLSGRTAHDLVRRVRVGGAAYLGNQGFERGDLGRGRTADHLAVTLPALDAWPATAATLAREVTREIPEAWLVVEPKPPAITFHFRAAPDLEVARTSVSAVVDRHDPAGTLVRYPGRRSLELRPPGAPDKGTTLEHLVQTHRPGVALMLGDDSTDVPAFQVLRQARRAGRLHGLAIGVGTRADAVEDTDHAVDARLADPHAVAGFLVALVRRLHQAS